MEFELNGQNYRAGKMPVRLQFNVARRLAPLFGALRGAAGQDASGDKEVDFFSTMAEVIASMSDADCDFVMDNCLALVLRQQDSKWVNITTPGGKIIVFDDIDMGTMIQIVTTVAQENLGSFFPAAVESEATSETTPPA